MAAFDENGFYLISSTEGCASNLYESSGYVTYLTKRGLRRVSSPEEAKYIIVNTCGYNDEMQKRSSRIILELKEKYGTEKQIVVGGCFPPMDKSNYEVEIGLPSFPPGDTDSLQRQLELPVLRGDEKVGNSSTLTFDLDETEFLTATHRLVLAVRESYFKFERFCRKKFQPLHNLIDTAVINDSYVPILTGRGCLGYCTFCAIKRAKGKIQSVPLVELISLFENLLAKGRNKIWLLGDDIGCWGQDINLNSSHLLKALLDHKGKFQLVVTNFDPAWLEKYFEDLSPLFGDRRVLTVNFPIQSGSDLIVKDMQRNYSVSHIIEKIKKLKKANPALGIKTDLIVGYPGESWADFFKSMRALFYFDAIFVNKYGRIRNTVAAKKENQIPQTIMLIRYYLAVSAASVRHFYTVMKSLFSGRVSI